VGYAKQRRPFTRVEVERFAESVRALLADPDAGLSSDGRLRWEGALAALEAVLREPSTLLDPDHRPSV
jgi:hypothetical protein